MLDLLDVPGLHHKVVLVMRHWDWSQNCCCSGGTTLLASGRHEVDGFIVVDDAFRDLGW